MSFPRRWRAARRRHPSAAVMAEHHVYVDHDDHGSRAYCECGQAFDVRLEPGDAHDDADLHLARALARRVLGHLADDLDDEHLLAVLAAAGIDDADELGAVVAVCRSRRDHLDDASGW